MRRRVFLWVAVLLSLGGCARPGGYGEGLYRAPNQRWHAGYHTIRHGDTLYSIAFQYGFDYRELARWNGIRPPYHIYPGQRLRPSGYARAALDAHVLAFYREWKRRYLVPAGRDGKGHPLYRVIHSLEKPEETVSEGMGYSMVIVAYMAGADPEGKTLFDGLFGYVQAHPSEVDPSLMAWKQPPDDQGNDAAFDGDADIAYALLLAARQWGSAGPINYAAAARTRIRAIAESMIGPTSRLPLLGNLVDPKGARYHEYTPRTSDFMPARFRAFATFTCDPLWNQVETATRHAVTDLETNYSPNTGLMPDFPEPQGAKGFPLKPARPNFLEGPHDGDYDYNADRYPWRAGTAVLFYDDAFWRARLKKLSHWAERKSGGNPDRLNAGYHLDVTPTEGRAYFTTFFAAPPGHRGHDPARPAGLARRPLRAGPRPPRGLLRGLGHTFEPAPDQRERLAPLEGVVAVHQPDVFEELALVPEPVRGRFFDDFAGPGLDPAGGLLAVAEEERPPVVLGGKGPPAHEGAAVQGRELKGGVLLEVQGPAPSRPGGRLPAAPAAVDVEVFEDRVLGGLGDADRLGLLLGEAEGQRAVLLERRHLGEPADRGHTPML